ncbi:hypothetical protein MTX80_23200 (plasmid) [Gordonia amicalis]|nr:hypothetical protein [Gordonia amicalis]UOG23826.1 hypothetical protein MTX80_23200 [Gordonia amicalis]
MGFKDRAKRAGAAAGIIAALGGLGGDLAKNSGPGLAKQQAEYTKNVRLPNTRRDTDRILRDATRIKSSRQKESQLLSKKDRKKLN